MIGKYILPEMGNVFSEENRFQLMLDVEITACEAMADIGLIPKEAYLEIKEKAGYDLARIAEIDAEVRHNTMAFLTCVSERIGESAKYLHMGMSSTDVEDTALSLQIIQAIELVTGKLSQLRVIFSELANEYKYTLMIGRTHGMHAEPITFGLKMALWVKDIDRSLSRLNHAHNVIMVGKINGAVGGFATIDPHIETFVCRRLGLHPAYVTTQSLQRDRHAECMTALALTGGVIEKMATEIRNLQRTEINEVEESVSKGQKGSTALPHKRNPAGSEEIAGLSRILRGNAVAALENIALWHERDTTHVPVERIIIPESFFILDYMLGSFITVMEGINVSPAKMNKNLHSNLGLIFSQKVLLALIGKGVMREQAYDWISRNASLAWEQQIDFQYLILEDQDISNYLSRREIMDLFDYDAFRKHIDHIFSRADI
ncbi:MAG: adenylosuccinate lyase [Bacillota bacterium]|nr:adenylosuccinate lyase [Bacillota bacterium]